MLRTIAFALLLAAPLCAQAPLKTGDTAPELVINYWLEVPEFTTLAEMRGDVVLIKAWGIN